jgi:hypothetical protein
MPAEVKTVGTDEKVNEESVADDKKKASEELKLY